MNLPNSNPNVFIKGLSRYLKNPQLEKIRSCKVGIGGAGGLGSNVAMILVRSGFEYLEIIDCDIIEPSNLNRQQYFLNEVGLPKVTTLAERLKAINPDVHIVTHQVRWTPETAGDFFKDCDIITEAFDQADSKFHFIDTYHQTGKPVISGNGMAGLLEKRPMTIKQLGNIYFVGDGNTDAAEGHPPMAPRVTACAAAMAEIILDLALL